MATRGILPPNRPGGGRLRAGRPTQITNYYIRFEHLQERVTKLEGGAAPARPKTDKEELGTWYERLVLARR